LGTTGSETRRIFYLSPASLVGKVFMTGNLQSKYVTQYTKADLESICSEHWQKIVTRDKLDLLICGLSFLSVTDDITDDIPDHTRLNRDELNECYILREKLIFRQKSGKTLKKAILFLFDYRLQLLDCCIDFPSCLFKGE
jgi:hypothetical protein